MCDTLCVIGTDRTLFAKNSDRPCNEVQVVETHPRRAAGGSLRTTYFELDDAGAYALIGSRPDWMWGLEHGINEHRVAIGNEKVWTTDSPAHAPPALVGMDLVRLGLERGASAENALEVMTDLLERHGQGGGGEEGGAESYWSSFLVVDPRSAWILETSGRSWVAQPVDDGAAISNRITLSTDWTRASGDVPDGADWDQRRDPEMPTEIGDVRLAVTRTCVATGAAALTPARLALTMRDHGPAGARPPADLGADWSGMTVCMHLRDYQATTSSIVAELPTDTERPLRAWVALGSPCTSVYAPVFPPELVPPEFAQPSVWRRFAALRDRVEANPAAAGEVHGVLRPLEAELWAEADAIADDPHGRTEFVNRTWPRVEAALSELDV